MKDSFILYTEQNAVIQKLSDEEAGKIIKAIYNYVETGIITDFDNYLDIILIPFKQNIDRNKEKYEKVVERNRENGKKGGRPKNPSGFKEKQKEPKKADNDNDNVNVNVNDNDNANDNENENVNVNDKKIHFAEFVSMTNAEYDKLVSTYGKEFADQCIEVLDNYKGANGKKYKSDYTAILNWVIDRVKASKPKEKSGNPFFDMLREEGKM